ncbi:DUF4249 domain-containing protein [Lacinutrix neustonica]|uniref:DUF4249 domain-containing protein n=1 Tax=Lacinutrix neustonica TaxID=2980107 RepID=A0A9E8MX70_9FLAO|nr:DUF4249 domain-containing protein [Lacinutrix neustonica]WAC02560.1 DUF4249 domain-containing protein [Lacinutrix neustonica]
MGRLIMRKIFKIIFVATLFICFTCIEEIELETQAFESVLVVEGTITNEFKFQEIKLSRTYLLEGNEQKLENNANVQILDSQGNTYHFTQNTEGKYVSNIEFEASQNMSYKLFITTKNGKQYQSLETNLTPISQINSLYAIYSDDQGVQIFVNSENDINGAQYFRYEYEETHKIVVPYYSSLNAIISNVQNFGQEYEIRLEPKTVDQRTCYTTNASIGIIQTSTNQLDNNVVERFVVRTLDKRNSLLRERYSILVKQYVQSFEAYNYYKIIKELGINESLLSESQPGYNVGNIESINNKNEKIAGYFEVASVSSKRLFFNYFDVGIPQPKYPFDCEYRTDETEVLNLNINHLILKYNYLDQRAKLYERLSFDNYKYLSGGFDTYKIVSPQCGDCTSFSSNIKPEFWQE